MSIFNFIVHILQDLFGKTDNWQQVCIRTSSTFYTSDDVCLRNNILQRKIISYVVLNRFKPLRTHTE